MIRNRWLWSCAIAACVLGTATAEEMTVKNREAPVRAKANPMADLIGNIKYGEKVEVLEKLGAGWLRVEHKAPSKLAGWVRTSDFTNKSLDVKNVGGQASTATAGETTEAAKGLLEDGEQSYVKRNNLAAAMAQVEALATNPQFKIEPGEKKNFLTQGGVVPKGGN